MSKSTTRCCVLVLGCAALGAACAPETTESGSTGGTAASTGGTAVSAGGRASGGRASGGQISGGTGSGGKATGGSSGSTSHATESMAYIGCSMGQNVADGYKRVGGTRMWGGYGTGGQVVQSWVESGSAWSLFDTKLSQVGGKDHITAIWIQICIFSSRATDAEIKSMIAAARAKLNPGVQIYITGQPLYEAGHECTLAGTGGAQWTDDKARQFAADTSVNQNMVYPGAFHLDSTKGEVMSDTCHATSPMGENVLGQQALAFWG
jgi:hypothetical protein